MIDKLIDWAVRNRITVLLATLALVIGGVTAARSLRVDAFPDLTNVQVQVLIEAPGLSPMEVERLATFPVEVSLNGLPRVTDIRSTTKYAFAIITVVFEDGTDINFARTLVAPASGPSDASVPGGSWSRTPCKRSLTSVRAK